MASTRNINTPGNYALQQRQYQQNAIYTLYKNSQYGEAVQTNLAGEGLLPAQIPADKLSNNSVDVESFLRGINSTNLVTPAAPPVIELRSLDQLDLYARAQNVMPKPLVIERNRPFPCP
jgi:hypothetical protein